jgi:uncharacterized protein HemX
MDYMNNNIPPSPSPTPTPAPAPMKQPSNSSAGSLIALLVILVLLAVGAVYFWGERGADYMSEESNAELDSINMQSQSDATADIEADLDATDVDGVDYDLDEENFNAS